MRFKMRSFTATCRFLAGVIAAIIFFAGLLAANGAFHEQLHHSDKGASNSCVLCLFAKGQVDLPESLPAETGFVQSAFAAAPVTVSQAPVGFTYLASLSRGPPASASLRSAIA